MVGLPSRMISGGVKTDCFCPVCEEMHVVKTKWRGRGIPRIRCPLCKKKVKGKDGYEPINPF